MNLVLRQIPSEQFVSICSSAQRLKQLIISTQS